MNLTLTPRAQKTVAHCGPTVLQMLLASNGVRISQDRIVTAAHIEEYISKYGMRPDMMAKAVEAINPKFTFWFKQPATLRDIEKLLMVHKQPIGVNWQGLFYNTVEEEKRLSKRKDHGHYSIIYGLKDDNSKIVMSDPYHNRTSLEPRIYDYKWFFTRWWDFVEVNGRRIDTKRLLFIITPKTAVYPKEMGMQPAAEIIKLFK